MTKYKNCTTCCIDISRKESEASQHGAKGTSRKPRQPSEPGTEVVCIRSNAGELFITKIQIEQD